LGRVGRKNVNKFRHPRKRRLSRRVWAKGANIQKKKGTAASLEKEGENLFSRGGEKERKEVHPCHDWPSALNKEGKRDFRKKKRVYRRDDCQGKACTRKGGKEEGKGGGLVEPKTKQARAPEKPSANEKGERGKDTETDRKHHPGRRRKAQTRDKRDKRRTEDVLGA